MNILTAGNAARKKLDALQAQIAALKKTISATEESPVSLGESRESMRAALKRHIEKDFALYGLLSFRRRPGRHVNRPDLPVISYGLLALVMGEDKLLDKLMAPLAEHEAAYPGIDAVANAKLLAESRAKLHDLEEREEREILKLQEDHWTVIRRGDADPHLLLEIWLAHRPETIPDVKAEPFGLSVPDHVNAGTNQQQK